MEIYSERATGNKRLPTVSWEHRDEKMKVDLYGKTDDEHSKVHYVPYSLSLQLHFIN